MKYQVDKGKFRWPGLNTVRGCPISIGVEDVGRIEIITSVKIDSNKSLKNENNKLIAF